jgi:serine/threonine-protein kinase RsbW
MEPAYRLWIAIDAEPTCPSLIRHTLEVFLPAAGWHAADADQLVLAVSELVSNVVEHAYGGWDVGRVEVGVEVENAGPRLGRACAVVADHGRWRPPGSDPDRGNGLTLVRTVVERLEIETGTAGTRATLRSPVVPLRRAIPS